MAALDGKSPYLYVVRAELANLDVETEFNEFYDQHTKDLCTAPGFLSGSRYQLRNADGHYLAAYELADLRVFESERYREISGWSDRNITGASGWVDLAGWRRAVYHVVRTFPEGPDYPGI